MSDAVRSRFASRRDFLTASLALPAGAFAGDAAAAPAAPMKLSCLPVSFFDAISKGRMPLPEWLDFAVELGLDGVECGPLLIQPLGPVTPAEFRRLADARRLPVSNFTSYSDFTHPDPEFRRREVAALIGTIQIARDLGAPSFRALTGQQRPGVDEAHGVEWAAESIKRVAEAADRAGIRVNVENHTKAFTWNDFDFAIRSSVFLRVLEAMRGAPVGVQFDVANPLVAGDDALSLFDRVKDRIGYIHLNDAARTGVFEFVAVGTGIAPIPELLRRLTLQGYSGWVSVEEQSRTGKEGFRQAVQFTRKALRSLTSQ